MAAKHHIGKCTIELGISSSKNAYALQQRISQMIWDYLIPELNKMFDTMIGEDEVLQLDKLEIEIGKIEDVNFNVNKVASEIVLELEKKIEESKREFKVHENIQKSPPDSGEILTEAQYHFKNWLYWLEYGELPVNAISPGSNWMEKVLEQLALNHDATVLLANLIDKNKLAFKRLILQHTPKDLKSIAELYSGFKHSAFLKAINELRILYNKTQRRKRKSEFRVEEIEIWQYALREVIVKRHQKEVSKLVTHIIEKILYKKWVQQAFPLISQTPEEYPVLQKIEIPKIDKGITQNNDPIVIKNSAIEADEIENYEVNPNLPEPPEKTKFFTNAGLVLIHPFLNRFFESLGLLKDRKFKDHINRSKAVLLLNHLAGGEEELRDFDLILPKFLCNMPVNIPIDRQLRLTKKEKQEAIVLLEAVIDHWGVLGATSPEGLQEGFLQRQGKLLKEQQAWKLYVEHKGIDVLLDRLPWNLGIIKLPWMKELMMVEWR